MPAVGEGLVMFHRVVTVTASQRRGLVSKELNGVRTRVMCQSSGKVLLARGRASAKARRQKHVSGMSMLKMHCSTVCDDGR